MNLTAELSVFSIVLCDNLEELACLYNLLMAISKASLSGTSVYQLQTWRENILSSESSFVYSKISNNFHYCVQIHYKNNTLETLLHASQTNKNFRVSIRNVINQSETSKKRKVESHLARKQYKNCYVLFLEFILCYTLFLFRFTLPLIAFGH